MSRRKTLSIQSRVVDPKGYGKNHNLPSDDNDNNYFSKRNSLAFSFSKDLPGLLQGKRLTTTSAQINFQAFKTSNRLLGATTEQPREGGLPDWALLHRAPVPEQSKNELKVSPYKGPPPLGIRTYADNNVKASTNQAPSQPLDKNDNPEKKKSKGLLSCILSSSSGDTPPITANPKKAVAEQDLKPTHQRGAQTQPYEVPAVTVIRNPGKNVAVPPHAPPNSNQTIPSSKHHPEPKQDGENGAIAKKHGKDHAEDGNEQENKKSKKGLFSCLGSSSSGEMPANQKPEEKKQPDSNHSLAKHPSHAVHPQPKAHPPETQTAKNPKEPEIQKLHPMHSNVPKENGADKAKGEPEKKKSKGMFSCIPSSGSEDSKKGEKHEPQKAEKPPPPVPSHAPTQHHQQQLKPIPLARQKSSPLVIHPPPMVITKTPLHPQPATKVSSPAVVRKPPPPPAPPKPAAPPHVSFHPNAKVTSAQPLQFRKPLKPTNAAPAPAQMNKAAGASSPAHHAPAHNKPRVSKDSESTEESGSTNTGTSSGSGSKDTSSSSGNGGDKKKPPYHHGVHHHRKSADSDEESSEDSEEEEDEEDHSPKKKSESSSGKHTQTSGIHFSPKTNNQQVQVPPPGSIRYNTPFPGIPIINRKEIAKDGRNFDVSQQYIRGRYDPDSKGAGWNNGKKQTARGSRGEKDIPPLRRVNSRSSRLDVSINDQHHGSSTIRGGGWETYGDENSSDIPGSALRHQPSKVFSDKGSNVNVFIRKNGPDYDDDENCGEGDEYCGEGDDSGWGGDKNGNAGDFDYNGYGGPPFPQAGMGQNCCCPPAPCPCPMPIPIPIPIPMPPPPPCCCSPCCCNQKKKKKKKKPKDAEEWNLITMYGMYTLFQQMHTNWQTQLNEQFVRNQPPPPPQYGVTFMNPMQMAMQAMASGQTRLLQSMFGCCTPPCGGGGMTSQPNPIFEVTGMEVRGKQNNC